MRNYYLITTKLYMTIILLYIIYKYREKKKKKISMQLTLKYLQNYTIYKHSLIIFIYYCFSVIIIIKSIPNDGPCLYTY
jgi:hypothetical protein